MAVAVTGGIGAGKSETLRAFERHGAAVISSDEIVHSLLRNDPEVKEAVVARFGAGILDSRGEIDRGRVAEFVFSHAEALGWLEELLHPRVVTEYLRWRDELGQGEDPPAVCATEVPLLYEVGGDRHFDAVVVVTAPSEIRGSRLSQPMTEREPRLIPDAEKAERADFVFVNDGTLGALDAFVSDVMATLIRR